jgi:GNAT superfamily N-acetyltransferase
MSEEMFRIVYEMERVLWQNPDQDQLDVWTVTLHIGHASEDSETGIAWEGVANATLYGLDTDRSMALGQAPFDVADSHSADAAYYYEHVFDVAGSLLPDVRQAFEWVTVRALFLHDVQVPRHLRRRGYASVLAADAVLTLAPTGTAVFAHPGPTDLENSDDDEASRLRSETANTRFLGSLGFRPFHDRLWLLDLSIQPAVEALANVRRPGRSG